MSEVLATLRRVNARAGLMIDAETWRDAHDYHRQQARLHNLALHGWGIVSGLGVLPGQSITALLVQPGLAIDPLGNFIVVGHEQVHRVNVQTSGMLYLTLRFREVLSDTRIVESFALEEHTSPPGDDLLELVRLKFDPATVPVRVPADPLHPGTNELDSSGRVVVGGQSAEARPQIVVAPAEQVDTELLARVQDLQKEVKRMESLERSVAELASRNGSQHTVEQRPELRMAIGRLACPGWDQHAAGLRLLARELEPAIGTPARTPESIDIRHADEVDLLYLAGQAAFSADETERNALKSLLERGGVVLGEGCAAGPSGDDGAREFALAFADLADKIGRQLTRVSRGHPVLAARYVFGEPPPTVRPARLLETGGIMYADADYGCAWQGGPPDRPLPRSLVRDALEFGINIAAYRHHGA